MPFAPRLRRLGLRGYVEVLDEMREYTHARTGASADQIWLVEHPPVYTLGQAGRREHVHAPGRIPVVASDRGGQVTYHGPGQVVAYLLIDLHRLGMGVRRLVSRLEQAVIRLLAEAGQHGERRPGAPGVYVDGRKLAALGLRVRRGCTYHGVAVNVDGDLGPFRGIDPCGTPGLPVTRLRDLGIGWTTEETGERLARALVRGIGRETPDAARCGGGAPPNASRGERDGAPGRYPATRPAVGRRTPQHEGAAGPGGR